MDALCDLAVGAATKDRDFAVIGEFGLPKLNDGGRIRRIRGHHLIV